MFRSNPTGFGWLIAFGISLLSYASAFAQGVNPPPPQARFAFIVGNDDYEGQPLITAANDAALVAQTLQGLGFDVMGARNLDEETLRASFREFLRKVEEAGRNTLTAVYISGYGLQVEGENYLVAPGSKVVRDVDVALNAVRLSDLLRALNSKPALGHLAIFDLAYESNFARQGAPIAPGLSLIEAETNLLTAFNAAPGMYAKKPQGDYGTYAQSISEVMRIHGLSLNDIFARIRTRTAELSGGSQLPWDVGHLSSEIILVEGAAAEPRSDPDVRTFLETRQKSLKELSEEDAYVVVLDRDTIEAFEEFLVVFPDGVFAKNVRGILAARREASIWALAVKTNSAVAYWSYLELYPKGPHASDARRRLARLSAPIDAPPAFRRQVFVVGPPSPEEIVFFDLLEPNYIAVVQYPPVRFLPPPPIWYQPPPPPIFEAYQSAYFLPLPVAHSAPNWWSPPAYVVSPPVIERPSGVNPYVAIPAALAVGIVAGKIISDRRPSWRPVALAPSGGVLPVSRFALPPTTTPPRPMDQIIGQRGLPRSQVQTPIPSAGLSGQQGTWRVAPVDGRAPATGMPVRTGPVQPLQGGAIPIQRDGYSVPNTGNQLPSQPRPGVPSNDRVLPPTTTLPSPSVGDRNKPAPGASLPSLPNAGQPRSGVPSNDRVLPPTTTLPSPQVGDRNKSVTPGGNLPPSSGMAQPRQGRGDGFGVPTTQPPGSAPARQPTGRPVVGGPERVTPPSTTFPPSARNPAAGNNGQVRAQPVPSNRIVTTPSFPSQRSAQPSQRYVPPQAQQPRAAPQQSRPVTQPAMRQVAPSRPAQAAPSRPTQTRNCGGPNQPKCR